MSSVDPFLVMVLGVLSGVVFVAFIHCVAASCIRNSSGTLSEPARPPNMHQMHHGPTIRVTISEASSSSSSSVDLPVHKYSKEFKEGMCAVCLGEFEENDEVRIMPECAHVFHVSCIDMWLFSHDNCPLCRASATPRARNVLFSIVTSSTVEQPGLNVV